MYWDFLKAARTNSFRHMLGCAMRIKKSRHAEGDVFNTRRGTIDDENIQSLSIFFTNLSPTWLTSLSSIFDSNRMQIDNFEDNLS